MISSTHLKKEIGAWSIALNMINIVIGAGIFIIPPIMSGILGPSSILAYLICGIVIFGIVISFAILGSKINQASGISVIVKETFGDYMAYMVNNLLWFGTGIIMNAALVNALADMLKIDFIPLRILFVFTLVTILALINVLGVKHGNKMVVINTIIKLIPLTLFIIIGIFYIRFEELKIVSLPEFSMIGNASLLLFFAFGGAESVLNLSGEIKDPSKDLWKGLILGFTMIMVVYLSVQMISQGVLGVDLVNHTKTPLADVAFVIGGNPFKSVLLVASIISVFSSISGGILSYPRALFASAMAGDYPSVLAKIHPTYKTPYVAIITYSLLIFLLSFYGGFQSLAVLSSGSLLIIYLLVLISILLNKNLNLSYQKEILVKGISVVSIIGILILLYNLKMDEIKAIILFVVSFSIIYYLLRYLKNSGHIN
jgi:basic amino acid/polyamine antiporter, APA family